MAEEKPRRAGRRSIVVAAVAALAGLLFATNASLFGQDESRSAQGLVGLARAESQRMEDSEEVVDDLRQQVDDIVTSQETADEKDEDEHAEELIAIASGRTPVSGPGIVIEMWDAPEPADMDGDDLHPDDLVVHQQDLEAVMNGLWSGGAEAMMIQDQRVTATSSVRCVGNVLLMHGRHYSPPYRISAIGDFETMRQAVLSSQEVQIYLQYVEEIDLGWSLSEQEDDIEMPAYTGGMHMDYAEVPEEYASAGSGSTGDTS